MVKFWNVQKVSFAVVVVLALGGAVFLAPRAQAKIPSLQCRSLPANDDDGDDSNPPETTGNCDSTETTLKYYLMQAGYNETAAAAIMGNISAESCGYKYKVCFCDCNKEAEDGFKAYTLQNGSYVANQRMHIQKKNGKWTWCGFGLVQWTHDSNPKVDRLLRLQKYADGQGKEITDLKVQIEFIIAELATDKYGTWYSKVLKPEVLNKYSLKDATWRVEKWYEAPNSVYGSPGYGASYATVCSDKTTSWCKSLVKRVERAEAAFKLDANCKPSDDDTSDDNPSNPTNPDDTGSDPDPVSVTPEDPGTDPAQTISTGKLGVDSSSGYYAQCNQNYSNKAWRKDGSTICDSGCSMVAVANAAKYLGVTPNSPEALKEYTKTVIKDKNDTGWGGSVAKTLSHVGLKWSGGTYLWSSYTTATSTKIAKIRQVLASGGVVIAGGDRKGKNNPNPQTIDCTKQSNLNAGLCAFSNNGHFITIIGITADDKLVIANGSVGRNGSSSNDKINANNVLKFSNKAIGVYK